MGTVKKYDPTPGELKTLAYVDSQQSNENKEVPWYQSYPSAIARGASKGVLSAGQGAGDPVGLMVGENGEELPPDEAWKMYVKLQEEQKQDLQKTLDQKLPMGTNLGPRMAERGTKATVEAVSNPLGLLLGGPVATPVRAALGGAGAEIAKDMGIGEFGQGVTEMGFQVGPDFGKNLVKRGFTKSAQAEKELISEMARVGLSDSEAALLMNQRGVGQDFAQTVATKGGWIPQRFEKGKKALGRVWDNLRASPQAQTQLNRQARSAMILDIEDQISRLPSEQAKLIQKDWSTLKTSGGRGTDIMDFWKKINYHYNKGEKQLGLFKGPLQKAMNDISPQLGKDFQLSNTLTGNFYKLSERMKPNVAATFIDAGEATGLLYGMITGNYPAIMGSISLKGARQLAAEMVTNPRFMNLGSKMINAVERNSPQIAKHIHNQMILEIGKTNAEAAVKLSEVDVDDLFKGFKKAEQEEEKEKYNKIVNRENKDKSQ